MNLLRLLSQGVFSGGSVPADLLESIILNLYKVKGDALEQGIFRGLKLSDQVKKLLERVLDSMIWAT